MSFGRICEQQACLRPAPAPNTKHQAIVAILTYKFFGFLQDKPCQVFPAPFDVRFIDEVNPQNQDIFIRRARIPQSSALGMKALYISRLCRNLYEHRYLVALLRGSL